MAITTTTLLPAAVQQSFDAKLLAIPVPHMIHKIASVKKSMPAHGGRILRMERYNPLATAMVPLGNSGDTPPQQNVTKVDIDAEISFFGTHVAINEQVILQSQSPILNINIERLGVSMRQTEDTLTRNMLASTATFVNCTDGINGDTPSEITRSDVDNVSRSLLNNDAKTIEEGIEGTNKFGTAPIRDAYIALGSTQLSKDLDNCTGFIHASQYPSRMAAPSERGSIGDVRFFLSSIGSYTAAASALGATVYNSFIVGQEAYASIEQDMYSAKTIYRGPEFSGPLAQNSTLAYKFAECPRILNDLWIFNLRTTLA